MKIHYNKGTYKGYKKAFISIYFLLKRYTKKRKRLILGF